MPQRLLENLKGTGKVFADQEFVADVQYDVRVYENYVMTNLLEGTGPSSIEGGTLSIKLNIMEVPMARFGQHLTLQLGDGRKLSFLLMADGRCEATGPIY